MMPGWQNKEEAEEEAEEAFNLFINKYQSS